MTQDDLFGATPPAKPKRRQKARGSPPEAQANRRLQAPTMVPTAAPTSAAVQGKVFPTKKRVVTVDDTWPGRGKYSGKPIRELAADPDYVRWWLSQPKLRDRYPEQTALLQANFRVVEATPIHNNMQKRFLDETFRLAFLAVLSGKPLETGEAAIRIVWEKTVMGGRDAVAKAASEFVNAKASLEMWREAAEIWKECLTEAAGSLRGMGAGQRGAIIFPDGFTKATYRFGLGSEAELDGDDLEHRNPLVWEMLLRSVAVATGRIEKWVFWNGPSETPLTRLANAEQAVAAAEAALAGSRRQLASAWDELALPVVPRPTFATFENGHDVTVYPRQRNRDGLFSFDDPVTVEIKPMIGDDYAAVLRQVRASGSMVVLVGRYDGFGATRDEFVQMFAASGKKVVFLDEVNAALPTAQAAIERAARSRKLFTPTLEEVFAASV
jgi:hypothetical protein